MGPDQPDEPDEPDEPDVSVLSPATAPPAGIGVTPTPIAPAAELTKCSTDVFDREKRLEVAISVRAAMTVSKTKYSTKDCPLFSTIRLSKYFFKLIINPIKKIPSCIPSIF